VQMKVDEVVHWIARGAPPPLAPRGAPPPRALDAAPDRCGSRGTFISWTTPIRSSLGAWN
jgi:hypothetical protein